MGEYISKQEVESIFRNARKSMKPENYKGDEFFIRDSILLNAEQIVHLMQAADVAPVMHGKWEEVEVTDYPESNLMVASMFCPKCKRYHNEVYHYGNPTEMVHFCPNCGARMDGEEDNNG